MQLLGGNGQLRFAPTADRLWRLHVLQICAAALPLFSCRWVKDHLLEGLVQMLSDAVPNVRLAALRLLPILKQTIRLPEDVERLVS